MCHLRADGVLPALAAIGAGKGERNAVAQGQSRKHFRRLVVGMRARVHEGDARLQRCKGLPEPDDARIAHLRGDTLLIGNGHL